MRILLALGSAAALVAVAACNRAEEAPPPPPADSANETAADAAAPASPEQIAAIMRERHDRYEEIGKAMKGIGDQLKARTPSVETIQQHADLIARYAAQVPTWFPAGSGPEAGRTRAKAEIWSDAATFAERARAFESEANRFAQVARGGDVEAIRAAQRDLGNACKNCHDRFRAPED